MNRLFTNFIFLMVMTGLVTAHADDLSKEPALLEEISFEKATSGAEAVIFKINTATVPKMFRIKGAKPRLVIDFFDTKYSSKVKNITHTEGQLVKSVRVGMHKDPPKTRVVVDLRTVREYDFKLDSQTEENLLVITFYSEEPRPEPVGEEIKEKVADVQESETETTQHLDTAVKGLDGAAGSQPVEIPAVAVPENKESPSSKAIVPLPEKDMIEAPETDGMASSAEKDIEGESQPAEDTVDKIIADIKDSKPIAADPILLDVTYESTANDSEMVLFKLNDFYPPIVFGIEKGNPRVVCDFLDTSLAREVQPVIQTNGKFVSAIRTARHPSPAKVRVVLDLVPNKNYDLQQVFFKEDNLFVIIISEFEEGAPQNLQAVPGAAKSK